MPEIQSPGTMADDATVGDTIWSSVNNAKVSDGSYATTATGVAGTSHYLKATNFGFTIPEGVSIDGIIVEVEKQTGAGGVKDNAIRIVKGGSIGSTDKSIVGTWPGTDTYVSHGGAADLWGETWKAEDINAADFGVCVSCISQGLNRNGNVDHIRITVYFSLPDTKTQINLGDEWKNVHSIQVNIGDVWKTVTGMQVNIGDVWKTVF